MKKNIKILVLLVGILLLSTGCNKQIWDFDYTYNTAICNIGGEWKKIPLSKWKDYDGEQLQLKDFEGNVYLVSSINCTLISGDINE